MDVSRQGFSLVFISFFLLLISGCNANPGYSLAAVSVEGFTEDVAIPYILKTNDSDASCQLGSSNWPLFSSLNDLSERPPKTLSLLLLLSANCSEQRAFTAELRSIRAFKAGVFSEAKDANTEYKTLIQLTAERRLKSYQAAMNSVGFNPDDRQEECPDFENEQSEMVFLYGLVTGLQAMLADTLVEGRAGVPRSIAPTAARAAGCFDNTQWGGTPKAIQAAVWLMLPDLNKDSNQSPWGLLRESVEEGNQFGVSTPLAIFSLMADSVNNEPQLAWALATLKEEKQINASLALIDSIALSQVQAVSDRLWTQKTGERTPFGKLGSMPQNDSRESFEDDDQAASALDDFL